MRIALVLLTLLLALPAGAVDLERFEIGAAFTIPHNEPIVQDMVARYKVEADGSIRFWKRFTVDANAKVWFLQDWRTPETVGHGFPDAWKGSDWNFEQARFDYNLVLGIDVWRSLQVFIESNKWDYLSEARPTSHVSEYYNMVGIKWRMK